MKKLHKILIAILIILSVSANAYYFGNEYFKKEKAKAFNQGVIYVFQRADEIGEIKLKIEDRTIILKLQK